MANYSFTKEGKTGYVNADMKTIPFVKYSVYGNTFIMVDETHGPVLTEPEKSIFARTATDLYFGAGADNFIVVQPFAPGVLTEIETNRSYWGTAHEDPGADFIFRMFESDGREALSCGNGLLAAAHHLNHRYGVASARILTEIPGRRPNVVTVGAGTDDGVGWVNMGRPRRAPPGIVAPSIRAPLDGVIDRIDDLEIALPDKGYRFQGKIQTLGISGYLVFTGEPHLVIFPDTGVSDGGMGDILFDATGYFETGSPQGRRNFSAGSKLVYRIGMAIAEGHSHLFPIGMNVDFVRITDPFGGLEYRCFERGINHETLSCGTGAIACCCVARALDLIHADTVLACPLGCRWYPSAGTLSVRCMGGDWFLYGAPRLVFEGKTVL
jgi:diaminopimelate epimerase